MARPRYYVTTPIYYPSADLHIGHAYTTVAADAITRFRRLQGYDAYFVTGTDEHSQKVERSAAEQGMGPQQFVDGIVAKIVPLWRALHIAYDDFIRTTEPRHVHAVGEIFKRIQANGDIYLGEYAGWYCTPCETFWLERQLDAGKCPDCKRQVELVREESYFFKLSKYQQRLLDHIAAHPDFIQPASRRNEMVSFIKQGLEDICVSRTKLNWGIPVPGDPKHVIYVWFDALANYITVLGWPPGGDLFQRYWPADVHLMGKEIVRFHAVIWPIILMALGLPLPKRVYGHGWLNLAGEKMSKSRGNVIDPIKLVEQYGVDAVRHFLLREVPFGADGDYSEEALIRRINVDLANDLGNLVHRTLAVLERFAGGRIPEPSAAADDGQLSRQLAATADQVAAAMDNLALQDATGAIFRLVGAANKYIDREAPWDLAKDPGRRERLHTVLYNLAETLRAVAVMLSPFLPEAPARIWQQLGLTADIAEATWRDAATWGLLEPGLAIQRGSPLFPRIEIEAPKAVAQTALPEAAGALLDIEAFRQVDLRTAVVVEAERVQGADKLLRLQVTLAGEERQIVAGIAEHYRPEDLIGKSVVVVANLKPAKIRGLESRGMLLAASDATGLAVLTPDRPVVSGSEVK
ncbi:MAG: methionine--tRNA ligase [Bacillota bacterium]